MGTFAASKRTKLEDRVRFIGRSSGVSGRTCASTLRRGAMSQLVVRPMGKRAGGPQGWGYGAVWRRGSSVLKGFANVNATPPACMYVPAGGVGVDHTD
jgi:hypothetical protein